MVLTSTRARMRHGALPLLLYQKITCGRSGVPERLFH
jgi:hypothetical protein